MSDRERKILIVTAAAVVVIFLIYFVKPEFISIYQSDTYSGESVQDIPDQQTEESVPDIPDQQTEEQVQAITDQQTEEQVRKAAVNGSGYRFRSRKHPEDHYEKHGIDMGFDSAQGYEKAAAAVVQNPEALHKTEAEDGDDVYYLQATNEFVIVSTDGYIRTYFKPDSGIKYFNRQ